jgi:hypothetical protein
MVDAWPSAPLPDSRAMTLPPPAAVPPAPPARDGLASALRELEAAEARRRPVDLVQALGRVGRTYRDLGHWSAAAWYLRQGLGWAHTLGGVDASIDLLCELADVEATIGQVAAGDGDRAAARAARDRARDHGFEATGLARQCADPQWEVSVLLRVSDVLARCGDHDDAAALQARAVHLIGNRQLAGTVEPRAPAPRRTM